MKEDKLKDSLRMSAEAYNEKPPQIIWNELEKRLDQKPNHVVTFHPWMKYAASLLLVTGVVSLISYQMGYDNGAQDMAMAEMAGFQDLAYVENVGFYEKLDEFPSDRLAYPALPRDKMQVRNYLRVNKSPHTNSMTDASGEAVDLDLASYSAGQSAGAGATLGTNDAVQKSKLEHGEPDHGNVTQTDAEITTLADANVLMDDDQSTPRDPSASTEEEAAPEAQDAMHVSESVDAARSKKRQDLTSTSEMVEIVDDIREEKLTPISIYGKFREDLESFDRAQHHFIAKTTAMPWMIDNLGGNSLRLINGGYTENFDLIALEGTRRAMKSQTDASKMLELIAGDDHLVLHIFEAESTHVRVKLLPVKN